MTFESFEPRGGPGSKPEERERLREALKAARSFARDPDRWLYLAGPTGTGKTHLAVAIANARVADNRPVMFRFVPDLLDYLRRTFSPESPVRYEQAFDRLRNAELLILDDLGAQASTPWAEEKLYQVIVHRHNSAAPTVITSRVLLEDVPGAPPQFLVRYSDAIASRLRDAHIVTEVLMAAPDFRHRGAVSTPRSRSARGVRRT
jgi:DNA replication protein DnaC